MIYQPNKEAFRKALQTAMPALMTGGAKTREDQMQAILGKMTAKTWRQDRDRLTKLLGA